ncbi:MAG: hypothetical protein ACRDJM_04355 [Actinomycetota bacterium]
MVSRMQRFVLGLMPRSKAAAAEAESRRWIMRCLACDAERSVWDAGGIRYKAAGTPRRKMRCHSCGNVAWHEIRRLPD